MINFLMPCLASRRLCKYLLAAALVSTSGCVAGWAIQDAGAAAAQQAAPDSAAQQKMLTAMGQYASDYISNLPNFICEQVTEQFQAGRKSNHWHKGDTLTSKLTFNQGKENYNLELVNNKPIKPGTRRWRTPLTTSGEFGVLLSRIFGGQSNASFRWNGWQTLNGKRVAVFDYSIDQQHSTLKISRSDLSNAVIPYHGSVYGDPDTGVIWRATDSASGLPDSLDTKSISTSVDYGDVPIGDKSYVMPVKATVLLETRDRKLRNELSFQNYRKFGAESTITFGGSTEATPKPHE